MKQTTQNIQNIMTSEFLQSAKELQKNAIKYSFPDAIWDATVAELQEKLISIYNFLSKQSNLIVVDQYTQNKRNGILSNLTQISNYLPHIASWNNYLINILAWTEAIYDFIYADLISPKHASSYLNEITELKQARKEYIFTTKDLQKLLENKNIASEFAQSIPEIQTKLDKTEASYQRIRELEQTIEQKKDIITWFSGEVENYKKSIEESQVWYKSLSEDNQIHTDELIKKNDELQEKVTEYLSDVIWWKSSKRLKERADSIRYWWWIFWIIITTLLLVSWSYRVSTLTKVGTDAVWEIFIKYLFISPLIILDIFFVTQYLSVKKLKEEYEFKAIVSGTLETYIHLLNDNDNRKEHKDFITSTANKIFESPVLQNDGIKMSDLKDISKQAIQKTIDKLI